jgi:hypothetical protein
VSLPLRAHPSGPRIAVLLPCYNEAATIAKVVTDFRAALPTASVFVYDNNSSDGSRDLARAAGAIVRCETRQGKGHVVRRMFADIEADIYLMVDADDTYDPKIAPALVERMLDEGLDLLNGARDAQADGAYRAGHRLGNLVLTGLVRHIFGHQFHDMLSGYKLFSRRFVKSFSASSSGFETETELTVHALELSMACAEVTTLYGERPEGSASKLRTYRDGVRILVAIGELIRSERPFQFFAAIGLAALAVAVALGIPILQTYFQTGLVPRFPTAFLALGLTVIATLCLFTGLTLDLIATARREMKYLAYLRIPSISPLQAGSTIATAASTVAPADALNHNRF